MSKYGQMGQSMKDGGKTIKLMAKEGSFTQTEMFMLEIGKRTKHMDMEFTVT